MVALAAAVMTVVGAGLFGAAPANADLLSSSNKDILKTSQGKKLVSHGFRDTYTYLDGAGVRRRAWNEGSRYATYAAYELLSHGDTSSNYYYLQVRLVGTLNRMDYPYRATPAQLRITANGTGVRVLDRVYTKKTTLGEKCKTLATIGLSGSLGVVSASSGQASGSCAAVVSPSRRRRARSPRPPRRPASPGRSPT